MIERHFPPAYYEDIETMARAAKEWIKAHPFACLVLEPVDPDKLPIDAPSRQVLRERMAAAPGENIGIIQDLTSALEWWGGNEPTRDMLRAMDAATDKRGSYTMAKAALDALVFPKSQESN